MSLLRALSFLAAVLLLAGAAATTAPASAGPNLQAGSPSASAHLDARDALLGSVLHPTAPSILSADHVAGDEQGRAMVSRLGGHSAGEPPTVSNRTNGPVDPTESRGYIVEVSGPTAWDTYQSAVAAAGLRLGLGAEVLPTAASAQAPFVSPEAVLEAAKETAFAQVRAWQAPVEAALTQRNVPIVSRYHAAVNGFLVYATDEDTRSLELIPGVTRVLPAPVHVPLVEDVVPQIGADEVASTLGLTGKDIHVAIIDTGIDYTHKSLGGSGRSQDWTAAYGSPASAQRRLYPNDKVIGGRDFAGTNYTGGNEPQPDNNPIDEHGHGSHVAGISAGDRGNRNLSHGVAPDAKLVALKVFGRRGSTNLATDAIEWAIKANMNALERDEGDLPCSGGRCGVDVINMSLGAPFADDVLEEMDVIRRAKEAGIVIVAAAGNDNAVGFITGSPAAAPLSLSVASSIPQGERADQIQLIPAGGPAEDVEALEAEADMAAQMADEKMLRAEVAFYGNACPGNPAQADVDGKIALVELGSCADQVKLQTVAGDKAVGMLGFAEGVLIYRMDGNAKSDIPAFMIPGDEGERLRDRLDEGEVIEAVFSYQFDDIRERTYLTDVISSFSSRGPSRLGILKPNIAAPGTQINAPRVGSGDNGVKLNGTSMASPAVAGAAALILQHLREEGLHEDVDAVDIATLLVNGAQATVWERDSRNNEPASVAHSGGGRVDVRASAELETLMRAGTRRPDSPGTPYGISFGVTTYREPVTETRPFFLRNLSDEARTYRLSTVFSFEDDSTAGVAFVPSAEEVSLEPGETVDLALEMRADPAEGRAWRLEGGDVAMTDGAMTVAEIDGYLEAVQVGPDGQPVTNGDVVRLPVYVLPRSASDIRFDGDQIPFDPETGEGTINLSNTGQQDGRVEMYVPMGDDDREPGLPVQLDIDWVGARVVRDLAGDRIIELLVHTREPRLVPYESQLFVAVDANMDDDYEWVMLTEDLGLWPWNRAIGFSGRQVSVLTALSDGNQVNLSPSVYKVDYYTGVDVDSRAIILPVKASHLGFGNSDEIRFQVAIRHRSRFGLTPNPDSAESQTDTVPDGSWGNRGVNRGEGVVFNTADIALTPGSWSFNLRAGDDRDLDFEGDDGGQLLAYMPRNGPDKTRGADLAVLTASTDIQPTATPTRDTRGGSHVYLPALKNRGEAPEPARQR